jgi:hypothetical protein
MTALASLYADGHGVPQDYVHAREWYEKAAVAGNSTAMNELGKIYANGLGVGKDSVKAEEWIQKAKESHAKE